MDDHQIDGGVMKLAAFLVLFAFSFPVFAADPWQDCRPPNWKAQDGEKVEDVAGCLEDDAVRKKYEASALAGDGDAANMLALFYLRGQGNDEEKALSWYRVYVKNKGGVPPLAMAQILAWSKVPERRQEAKAIYRSYAKAGGEDGEIAVSKLISLCREDGDEECEHYWVERSALSGDYFSMERLGEILVQRPGASDKAMGAIWLWIAAELAPDGRHVKKQLEEKAKQASRTLDVPETTAKETAINFYKALGISQKPKSGR
jgi:hypothetical protein